MKILPWCVAFLFFFLKETQESNLTTSDDKIQLYQYTKRKIQNVTCALGAYSTIHNVIIENHITYRVDLVLLFPKPHVVTP